MNLCKLHDRLSKYAVKHKTNDSGEDAVRLYRRLLANTEENGLHAYVVKKYENLFYESMINDIIMNWRVVK